ESSQAPAPASSATSVVEKAKSSPCSTMPRRTPCAIAALAYWRRITYGSVRRSLAQEIIMPMTMIANGSDVTTMIDWSPPSASSPPASSSEPAVSASSTPQTIVTHAVGSGRPRWLIEPMTIEAESAEVTKKTMIDTMAITAVTPAHGRLPSMSNSIASDESAPETSLPSISIFIDAPPKTVNQAKHAPAGTRITTVTNSRRVRPREILAMNMPTNGVQETHQAQ